MIYKVLLLCFFSLLVSFPIQAAGACTNGVCIRRPVQVSVRVLTPVRTRVYTRNTRVVRILVRERQN